jgi:hypothetical protein
MIMSEQEKFSTSITKQVDWDEIQTINFLSTQGIALRRFIKSHRLEIQKMLQPDGNELWIWSEHIWLPKIVPGQRRIKELEDYQMTVKFTQKEFEAWRMDINDVIRLQVDKELIRISDTVYSQLVAVIKDLEETK